MSRPTYLRVNLNAIRQNYALAQTLAPQSRTLAVIKANAYGCGVLEVAKALADVADGFAVALVEEAIALRKHGIKQNILVLQGAFNAQELHQAHKHDLWLTVTSLEQIRLLEQQPHTLPEKIWLKVNIGMNRLGIEASGFKVAYSRLLALSQEPSRILIMGHHSCADSIEPFTQRAEMTHFQHFVQQVSQQNSGLSEANSACILAWPDTHADWNRAGIMLYGVSPFANAHPSNPQLQPACSLITHIHNIRTVEKGKGVGYGHTWTAEKDSRIATLPIGYADGYPRTARNGTPCAVNTIKTPLVGTVSMDMVTIDISHIPNARVGDPVELWGENISIWEVAKMADTSAYDILAGVGQRVSRKYGAITKNGV